MKQIILSIVCIIVLISCSENSHIPNTSIIDELPTNELAEVLEYEKEHPNSQVSFEKLYTGVRELVDTLSEVDKAKYLKLTYRELYSSILEVNDSTLINKLNAEWQAKYDELLPRAKQEGKEFFTNQAISIRALSAKYYSLTNRKFYVFSYLRSNHLLKYYNVYVHSEDDLWDESNWNYVEYIHSYIDQSFTYQSIWTYKQALATIRDKYPFGYQYLLDRINQYEEYLESR